MSTTDGAQPPANPVQPQPLPIHISMIPVRLTGPDGQPGQHMLLWEITTPAGTTRLFTDRAFTAQVGQMLGGHLANWPDELLIPQLDLSQLQLPRNGQR